MKKYSHFQFMYKGFQLQVVLVTKTKKEAKEILGLSDYMINTWVNVNDINDNDNFELNKKYYRFDQHGGEVRYFLSKEEIEKYYSIEEIKAIIDNHRILNKTYQETENNYKTK